MTTPPPVPPAGERRHAPALTMATLLVAALIGVVIGVAGERLAIHHRWGARPFGRAPFGAASEQRRVGDRIARELDLTPTQRVQVDSIMAHNLRDIEQVRREVRPRMREIFVRTRAQMDSVLTPAQRRHLDSMFTTRRRGRSRGPMDGQ